MKNKFIEFIKKEKNFIFGIGYLVIGDILVSFYSAILKRYSISAKDAFIVIICVSYSFEFWGRAFKLFFEKNKVQK